MFERGARRRLARGTVAALVAVAAATAGAPAASAHDSAFDGHYTESGVYWQLNYKGPLDQYGGGCYGGYGNHHYHDVNHNYRASGSGTFYFYHQRYHWISCVAGSPVRATKRARRAAGTGAAEVEPPAAHAADERRALQRTMCTRAGLFCKGDDPGGSAVAAVARLRGAVPLRVLRLTSVPTIFNPNQNLAEETPEPALGECVVGVLDREGRGAPAASALSAGVTLEVTTPEVAERLGHPCTTGL